MSIKDTEKQHLLITQAPSPSGQSPYSQLAKKYPLRVSFQAFFEIKPVSFNDIRKQRVDIGAHTAIIFTSRTNIDRLFRLYESVRVKISPDMKYFCSTDQIMKYLHKYIVVKKRKVFTGQGTIGDLVELLKKHPKENYLLPVSDTESSNQKKLTEFFESHQYRYKQAIIYRKIPKDLSNLSEGSYDIIAFFSPANVQTFIQQLPQFDQKKTRLAAFGTPTIEALQQAGLKVQIQAPTPTSPSMVTAIEHYLQKRVDTEKPL